MCRKHQRILFFITDLSYGGAENELIYLATRLKLRGWDVRIISLMSPEAYTRELESARIPLYSLGIRRKVFNPQIILRIAQIIRTYQPHIVHSHMVHANLLARAVSLIAQPNVLICTSHTTFEGGRHIDYLCRVTDPLCDLTTHVSQVGLDRYIRNCIVPKNKIRYIPNGVDIEYFHPDLNIKKITREELGLQNIFLWLACGRFSPPKDYTNLLHAFAHTLKEKPDTLLIIVGDGPLRSYMETLAEDLGLRDKIIFLGIRHDLPRLMNAADGYVMSSAWEGMPMVLLEASAVGLPIVATNVGDNANVVLDGQSGILVPPKNSRALANAMVSIMNCSEDQRLRMGEISRQYIENNYSLDHVVDKWEALYRELLGKKANSHITHNI